MNLGSINQVVGATIRHKIDYRQWLDRGEVISNAVVSISGTTTATIGIPIQYSLDKKEVWFYLAGGTLNDSFELLITITTNIGQTKVDSLAVNVVSP